MLNALDDGHVVCSYSVARIIETDSHPNEKFKREL